MKYPTMAALVAAQLLATARPAFAAELNDGSSHQMGAFGGVRVRVPLDGDARQRPVRAGLTIAPTMLSRSANGEIRARIGEGLELGFNDDDRVRLSLAGTPVARLAQGGTGPDGRRAGVSTIGWIAIGVGVLATGFVLFGLCVSGDICDQDED